MIVLISLLGFLALLLLVLLTNFQPFTSTKESITPCFYQGLLLACFYLQLLDYSYYYFHIAYYYFILVGCGCYHRTGPKYLTTSNPLIECTLIPNAWDLGGFLTAYCD